MFFKNLSTILSLLRESGAKVSVIFETSKSFGKFFSKTFKNLFAAFVDRLSLKAVAKVALIF